MRTRPSLRTRLLVAFVGLAAGVLLLAGATTYFLVRGTAVETAKDDLRDKADTVVEQAGEVRAWVRRIVRDGGATTTTTPSSTAGGSADAARETGGASDQQRARQELELYIAQMRRVLRLADARVVFVDTDGEVLAGEDLGPAARFLTGENTPFALPPDLTAADLRADRLLAGDTVVDAAGSVVYLARPVDRLAPQREEIPVLVLTQTVDTDVIGRAAPAFLIAAAVALLVCVAVSLWLARRMTRPLRRVQETAARLADGDLTARVAVPSGTEDELASLAATLNLMAQELEQARGAERAFLLSISHDLRTPLTSIRGYAEALADGTLDDADPAARARAAAIIGAEGRRLERLVRDLLDLSRLDSRRFSLHPRRCDAAEVVRESVQAFEPAAAELGLMLHLSGSDSEIVADLDPDRLGQIVANLVENALKYAAASVTVETRSDARRVEVTVADDGPGIPAEDAGRVFERLYTSRKAPARAVGTGLGLAIVRELAQAMGGNARIDSANGSAGARFVVSVPLGPAAVVR